MTPSPESYLGPKLRQPYPLNPKADLSLENPLALKIHLPPLARILEVSNFLTVENSGISYAGVAEI